MTSPIGHPDKDTVRLRHALDAASKAQAFILGKKRADLDTDEKLALALIHLLETVSDAARNISSSCRQRHPQIPWEEMAGIRDRLIHDDIDVDRDVIWNILTINLPPLVIELEKVVLPSRSR